MDFCRNVQVSGGLPSEYEQEQLFPPSCSKLGSLDDLFSGNTTEEGDVHLEWLSIFVEDCLSSSGNCLPPTAAAALPPQNVQKNNASNNNGNTIIPKAAATSKLPLQVVKSQKQPSSPSSILHRFVIPGKARSKRSRGGPIGSKTRRSSANFTSWSHHLQMTAISDPPLLQQAYWLADSELILPKTEENKKKPISGEIIHEENKEEEEMNNVMVEKEEDMLGSLGGSNGQQGQPRRCTHCLSQRTPQWRAGPLGPKTLCNACGVRYKSGRLLPEYRPAKSPTFVSYKHSNSHKKVLEMRTMSLLSSDS